MPVSKRRDPQKVHPLVGADTKRAWRTCIRCDKSFNSRNPANRICITCKRILGDLSAPRIYRLERGVDQSE